MVATRRRAATGNRNDDGYRSQADHDDKNCRQCDPCSPVWCTYHGHYDDCSALGEMADE